MSATAKGTKLRSDSYVNGMRILLLLIALSVGAGVFCALVTPNPEMKGPHVITVTALNVVDSAVLDIEKGLLLTDTISLTQMATSGDINVALARLARQGKFRTGTNGLLFGRNSCSLVDAWGNPLRFGRRSDMPADAPRMLVEQTGWLFVWSSGMGRQVSGQGILTAGRRSYAIEELETNVTNKKVQQ
jgi:hypothetical protein